MQYLKNTAGKIGKVAKTGLLAVALASSPACVDNTINNNINPSGDAGDEVDYSEVENNPLPPNPYEGLPIPEEAIEDCDNLCGKVTACGAIGSHSWPTRDSCMYECSTFRLATNGSAFEVCIIDEEPCSLYFVGYCKENLPPYYYGILDN